ncbi:MAG: hypothetical protein AAFV01_04215 [Bacteroidota bacterium]
MPEILPLARLVFGLVLWLIVSGILFWPRKGGSVFEQISRSYVPEKDALGKASVLRLAPGLTLYVGLSLVLAGVFLEIELAAWAGGALCGIGGLSTAGHAMESYAEARRGPSDPYPPGHHPAT